MRRKKKSDVRLSTRTLTWTQTPKVASHSVSSELFWGLLSHRTARWESLIHVTMVM